MDKLAQQISDLAAYYGPQVHDNAFLAVQVDSVRDLLVMVLLFIFAAGLLFVSVKVSKSEDMNDFGGPLIFISGAFGLACAVSGLCILFDPWTWIPLFRPDLYLAHVALHI